MVRKKTKFKTTIKELTFEFEGDQEEAQQVQAGLNRVISGLMHTQNQLLDVDEADYQDVSPSLPSSVESSSEHVNQKQTKSKRRSRTPRDNARSTQIQTLKEDGFIAQKRDLSAIREALENKGFNFAPKDISSTMKYLTQKGDFQREKDDGNFVYWSEDS